MFNLPKNTEVKKQVHKKLLYEKFKKEMNPEKRKEFDADISKIAVINEISPVSVNIPSGENVKSIFVVEIQLKNMGYRENNIILLSKLFGQKLLLALNYENKYKLAAYQTKLIATDWLGDKFLLNISGLTLDKVWDNFVMQVGGIELSQGNSLDEQIIINGEKEKLERQIEKLEKQAWNEIQPQKKYSMAQRIKEYKKQLEEM